jgi:hypothetical protein
MVTFPFSDVKNGMDLTSSMTKVVEVTYTNPNRELSEIPAV